MSSTEVIVSISLAGETLRVGTLWFGIHGRREYASFDYDQSWLKTPGKFALEPALVLGKGPFHAKNLKRSVFGAISDSAPDRWGRILMDRAEHERSRSEKRTQRMLFESDYLLGVNDEARLGALRFSSVKDPDKFLASEKRDPIPPLMDLGKLLSATERVIADKQNAQDLKILLDPGSSLGGARPKASVRDKDGTLTIAKFPSKDDTANVVVWEAVVLELAKQAGIRVPLWRLKKVLNKSVLLIKRFDRNEGQRVPFLSAMSMLGNHDHERHSYLEIAGALIQHGASPNEDLAELWRRIIFTIMVNNTDDHLRNHGFLYARHAGGWRLSPAYDINPTIGPRFLSTAINDYNTAADLDLAREVAPEFRLSKDQAEQIIREVSTAVSRWKSVATRLGLTKNDRDRMSSAFDYSTT